MVGLQHSNNILAVDLDGTLLQGDMLATSLRKLLSANPLYLLLLPFWLLRGKAGFKRAIAQRVSINPVLLEYRAEVLAFINTERESGRHIILATGSDELLVTPVAAHLGCFDEVLASDGKHNRSGQMKCQWLVERFGERGFDYIGNSSADIEVWRRAGRVLMVSGSQQFNRRIHALFEVERVFY